MSDQASQGVMEAAAGGSTAAPVFRTIKRPPAVRNVLANWLAFAFGVGVNFFLSPFVVHSLGDRQYGIWVLLGSLVGYMGLLDLGVRSAVMRYVARHHARTEDAEASDVASAGLAIFSVMGLAALTASVGIALLLQDLFSISPDVLGIARLVIVIGGLNVALALMSGVFGGAVAALQRFDLLGFMEIGIGAARAISVVLALRAGWGLVALAVIQLACTVARGAIQYAYTHRLYPQLRYRLQRILPTDIRKIFSFSIYSSLLHMSGALIFSADSVVIGAFLPVAAITYFAIGASLTDYTRSIIAAISQTITPRASALDGVGAGDELQRVLLTAASTASLVVLPICITFLIRGPSFIGLWMGAKYGIPSGGILVVLTVALSFAAARQVAMSLIIGLNEHRKLVPFIITEGLLNLGLSIHWIHSLGIVGVALGTAIPNLVTSILVIPWALQRLLGLSKWQTWGRFWLRPLAAMVPFAIATYAIERWHPAHGLIEFFAGVLAALPLAAAGAWLFGLSPDERRGYLGSLMRPLQTFLRRA